MAKDLHATCGGGTGRKEGKTVILGCGRPGAGGWERLFSGGNLMEGIDGVLPCDEIDGRLQLGVGRRGLR